MYITPIHFYLYISYNYKFQQKLLFNLIKKKIIISHALNLIVNSNLKKLFYKNDSNDTEKHTHAL